MADYKEFVLDTDSALLTLAAARALLVIAQTELAAKSTWDYALDTVLELHAQDWSENQIDQLKSKMDLTLRAAKTLGES